MNRDLEQMWRSLWAALVRVMRDKRRAFVNAMMNIQAVDMSVSPSSSFLFEKPAVPQPVKKSPSFMEIKSSSPRSQQPVLSHGTAVHALPSSFLRIHFNIILQSVACGVGLLSVVTGSEVKNEWSYTSGPLYAFISWTREIVPLYVTIWLQVLRTATVFIHRPIRVLCSAHATYPVHPRRLHVSPEVHIFTSSASLSTGKRRKRIIYSILRSALHCRQGHTALYSSADTCGWYYCCYYAELFVWTVRGGPVTEQNVHHTLESASRCGCSAPVDAASCCQEKLNLYPCLPAASHVTPRPHTQCKTGKCHCPSCNGPRRFLLVKSVPGFPQALSSQETASG